MELDTGPEGNTEPVTDYLEEGVESEPQKVSTRLFLLPE